MWCFGSSLVVIILLCYTTTGYPQYDYDYIDNSFQFPRQNRRPVTDNPQQRPTFTFVRPPGAEIPLDGTTTVTPPNLFTCMQGCIVTSQYNPLCGTDGQTYNNISRLRCAQSCGQSVEVRRNGPCFPAGK